MRKTKCRENGPSLYHYEINYGRKMFYDIEPWNYQKHFTISLKSSSKNGNFRIFLTVRILTKNFRKFRILKVFQNVIFIAALQKCWMTCFANPVKPKLTGRNLGRVFNSRCGCACGATTLSITILSIKA